MHTMPRKLFESSESPDSSQSSESPDSSQSSESPDSSQSSESSESSPTASPSRALLAFLRAVYAPGLHLVFAAAWLLAITGATASLTSWSPGLREALGIVSVFLVLFFLRVVDELKDFEYDREHNPDRPLVSGMVQRRDLAVYLMVSAVLVVWVNAYLGLAPLVLVVIDMAWGWGLLRLEKLSSTVRDSMWLNLVVTYPVNVLLSIYALALMGAPSRIGWFASTLLVVGFACAFLAYEIARKTCWPEHALPGERLYSTSLGGRGAATLVLALASAATVLVLAVQMPWHEAGLVAFVGWLQLLAPAPLVAAAVRFLGARGAARLGRKPLAARGMVYLSLFYFLIIARAVIIRVFASSC